MRGSPPFFVRVFIAAQHEQCDVGSLRDLRGFGDQSPILRRIAEMCSISKPVAAFFCDLAAFGVSDFDPVAHLVFNSLKHTHAATGTITVAAGMVSRRIWTDHAG